jgi:hypothetical protein
MGVLEAIKRLFGTAGRETEAVARGSEPDATPGGGGLSEADGETSTNAQTQGASDEPWPGTR